MITGYDISSNNANFGGYDTADVGFCVVKASEGTGYKNPLRFAQAAWVRSRGMTLAVYHWVLPTQDVHAQAQNFADAVAGMGPFAWWALDIEDPTAASDQQWSATAGGIRNVCMSMPVFGPRDVAYVGQFFHSATMLPLAHASRWWLPDYAVNDGAVHPTSNNAQPMIHQYTSVHGLDRNIVTDEGAYNALLGARPTPVPPPATEEEMAQNTWLFKSKAGTLFLYDEGKVIEFTSNNLVKAINVGRALDKMPQLTEIDVEDDAATELAALAAGH